MDGRGGEALRCLQEARQILTACGGRSPYVAVIHASALTVAGRAREAREAFAALDAFLEGVDPLTPQGQSLVMSLTPTTWLGDFDRGARYLSRWVGRARESGSLAFLGSPQAFGAELDFRRGRWRDAEARAAEAVRSLEETGQHGSLGFALITLATIEAALGRADDCRANVRRASKLAEELGLGSIATYRGFALGLLNQGLGRPASAVTHLEPLVDLTREAGFAEPAIVMWQPDLVEAYARLGRLADARRALATLAEQAERTGGVVGARRHPPVPWPDRRRHRPPLRRGARAPREAAHALRTGADGAALRSPPATRRASHRGPDPARAGALPPSTSWVRCRGRPRPGRRSRPAECLCTPAARPRSDGELSPRELQVARTVARGLTNREAAARLFLSEKTIERHLSSVYRKLGLRSRAELARRFAREDDAPHEPGGG